MQFGFGIGEEIKCAAGDVFGCLLVGHVESICDRPSFRLDQEMNQRAGFVIAVAGDALAEVVGRRSYLRTVFERESTVDAGGIHWATTSDLDEQIAGAECIHRAGDGDVILHH